MSLVTGLLFGESTVAADLSHDEVIATMTLASS